MNQGKIHTYKDVLKRNYFDVIFYFMLFLIVFGLTIHSGLMYWPNMLILMTSFLSFKFLLGKIAQEPLEYIYVYVGKFGNKYWLYVSNSLYIFTILFISYHFYYLSELPFFESWKLFDYKAIFHVRNDITLHASSFVNYFSSFTIKAFLPFCILNTLLTKNIKLHILFLVLGSFYCLNLLQKGYFLFLYIPSIIHLLMNKRFLKALGYFALPVFFIVLEVYVANPELRESDKSKIIYDNKPEVTAKNDENIKGNAIFRITEGLYKRVFEVPGKIVYYWFENVPSQLPYLHGDGYSLVAKLKHHELKQYDLMLYDVVYPEYANVGIHGSVNGAFFIYDYANFGKLGLLLSGFMASLLLFLIHPLLHLKQHITVPLLTYHILILSSSSLSTVLFSGGLGFLIFMIILEKKQE